MRGSQPTQGERSPTMAKLIGLLHGEEETFPTAFIEEVNARKVGVVAEAVKVGGLRADQPVGYDLIVDRMSHRVNFYRDYLKFAVGMGQTICINDPFRVEQDNRFLRARLGQQAGLKVPRSVMLPSCDYPAGLDGAALSNLVYPLPWEEMLAYVGLPAVVRPIRGERPAAARVNNLKDLWEAYGRTGQGVAELTETIPRDQSLAVFCVGKATYPVAYDAVGRRYQVEKKLDSKLASRAAQAASRLVSSLGLDVAAVEVSVHQHDLYLIDLDACPTFDWWALSEDLFIHLVASVADLAIERLQRQPKAPKEATPSPRSKNLSNTKAKS